MTLKQQNDFNKKVKNKKLKYVLDYLDMNDKIEIVNLNDYRLDINYKVCKVIDIMLVYKESVMDLFVDAIVYNEMRNGLKLYSIIVL